MPDVVKTYDPNRDASEQARDHVFGSGDRLLGKIIVSTGGLIGVITLLQWITSR